MSIHLFVGNQATKAQWETLIHEPQIRSGGEEVFQALLSIYDIISDSIMKWQDKTDFLLHKYHDIFRENWEE